MATLPESPPGIADLCSAVRGTVNGDVAGEPDGYLWIYILPCEELRMATLPEGLTNIGELAFCCARSCA